MSGNEQTAEERLDIAVERIASEKTARTGRLDLGNLGLTRLPTALSELHWLEELRLRGAVQRGETVYRCSVEEGWEETDETLNPNRIEDLTPLAALTALQTLYCWDAPVSNLPEAVIGLPRLKEFSIGGLPSLDEIPAEVLSQGFRDNCLPRLVAHFADLDTGSQPLQDPKVIVLGNGRVGKTQICRRLRGDSFKVDADSTHGISVTSMEYKMPENEEPAILNLWDFGAQDIYHGTHALFMRTRAVFLLVWTPDSEQGTQGHAGMVFRNQPLPYWLEYIRHLGGRSPVIVVQNRCDKGLGERPNLLVDDAFLRPFLLDEGRLFKRVAYSAKDGTGHSSLMEALQQAVSRLRDA